MKIKQLLGVALVGVMLSGCTNTPKDVDSSPIHEQLVVKESVGDLYYRLTTTDSNDPFCGKFFRNAFYQDRGEFRIYYGFRGYLGNDLVLMNGIYGKGVEGGTEVVVRDTQWSFAHDEFSRKIANFVKTGSCS